MTEEEKWTWGANEREARKADIAMVKAGRMSLQDAQGNATERAQASGMHPADCFHYMAQSRHG